MKRKWLFLVSLSLLASVSFAQRETWIRTDKAPDYDAATAYKWTDYYESERFVMWHSANNVGGAQVAENTAKSTLEEMEKVLDDYLGEINFQHAYPNLAQPTADRDAGKRYKLHIVIICQTECGGWTDGFNGGMAGLVNGVPTMWVSKGSLSFITGVLGHELMHTLQQTSGGFRESDFVGWLHESHASMMPYYASGGKTEGITANTEGYIRRAYLGLGMARSRYYNWHYYAYLENRYGMQYVNDLWSKAYKYQNARTSDINLAVAMYGESIRESFNPTAARTADPFGEQMRINGLTQKDFGDIIADYAMKSVIWDMGDIGKRFKSISSYANPAEANKRHRFINLEPLEDNEGGEPVNNRYVVPFALAPQRYAYNIIRLYPDETGTIKVRFRGDVQTTCNIPNYTKNNSRSLEPNNTYIRDVSGTGNDNPGSDWRYGLVVVTSDSVLSTRVATARYSDIKRASDGNPDLSITLNNGEKEVYLVVAATPTVNHKIKWEQVYYTIYRFPYMVEITGAKPEGFQTVTNPAGAPHSNGGGFVQSTAAVASTAYVGPNAKVLGTAQVQNNARIEGRAVVKGSSRVSDNAVVKGNAMIAGGRVYGDATVSENAYINHASAEVYGNAKVHGAASITGGAKIFDNAQVGGVTWLTGTTNLSGTAQLLGDSDIGAVTRNAGVYYGESGNTDGYTDLTAALTEVTAPRSMEWYGDDDGGIEKTTVIAKAKVMFNLNRNGIFHYDLGSYSSATLKIFNLKGSVLKTMQLNGAQGAVDTQLKTTQVLLFRVESNGKIIGQTRGQP